MSDLAVDQNLKLLNKVRTVHMDEGNSEYEEILTGLYHELENPSVLSTMIVEQIAQAFFWIKRHSLDKEGLLNEQLKNALTKLDRYGDGKDLLALYQTAVKAGRYSEEYEGFVSLLADVHGTSIEELRTQLYKPTLDKLKLFDDLIHRQLQNLRHLQKSLDAVDFKKRLVKKLDLEIAQMEKDALAIEAV